jgi:hypothetical protein
MKIPGMNPYQTSRSALFLRLPNYLSERFSLTLIQKTKIPGALPHYFQQSRIYSHIAIVTVTSGGSLGNF